ncbi:MAG: YhfC family intramembrane metalloprotease [Candidatus Altiarchaeota archaeon]|nr:YhfC family intramembrane metalloprotease [Candidatus Altiarchaeota archaeon]
MDTALIVAFILAILVDIMLPLLLVYYLIRKFRTSWKLAGWGALIFIAVQVLHIGFLWLINDPAKSLLLQLPQTEMILLNAALLGILAGLFEEIGRYLSFRYIIKKARTWKEGLMFGAGWGGVESFAVGILVIFSLINVIVLPNMDMQSLNATGQLSQEQLEQIEQAKEQITAINWYDPLFGAMERVFTIVLHLALTLIVLQCFIQNRKIFLLIAILFHSLVDSLAVAMLGFGYSVPVIEGVIFLTALISLWVVSKLKV